MGITIQFVQDKALLGEQTSSGYWIVILTIMIYSGLAVSNHLIRAPYGLMKLNIMNRLQHHCTNTGSTAYKS